MFRWVGTLWILSWSTILIAQSDFIIVNDFIFVGNRHTKPHVIKREIAIKPGDTVLLANLPQILLEQEKRILTSGLFTLVNAGIKNWDTESHKADILFTLQENWYIYPAPIFELADRNFNVWWNEQNRSLDRINYGINVDHVNLTGNHDRLKLKMQFGYTRKYEAKYRYRYLNAGEWGIEGSFLFSESREAGYVTHGNKTRFYRAPDDRKVRSRTRGGLTLTNRSSVWSFHEINAQLHHNTIDPFIANHLNQDYFLEAATSLSFFRLQYQYKYDKRVFGLYPIGGYALTGSLTKEGFGILSDYNALVLEGGVEFYFQPDKRWIAGTDASFKSQLIRDPLAFANNTALGYDDRLVRGYELYVIDGSDYGLLRSQLSFHWLNKQLRNKVLPVRQFLIMDIDVFIRCSFDIGAVYDPSYSAGNTLNGRFLIGGGPAIDIVLFNNARFSLEYNWNHLGEGGLYMKGANSF